MKEPRAVQTEKETVMLLPPEVVSAPLVTQVALSRSQQYVLVLRTGTQALIDAIKQGAGAEQPPQGDSQLLMYDVRKRETKELWRFSTAVEQWQEAAWLPGSDTAVVLLNERVRDEKGEPALRNTLVWAAPGSPPVVTNLPSSGPSQNWDISISPDRPAALLTSVTWVQGANEDPARPAQPTVRGYLYPIDARGHVQNGVPLPEGYPLMAVRWSVDGVPVLRLGGPKEEGGKRVGLWAAFDSAKQQIRELEAAPTFAQPLVPKDPKAQDPTLEGLRIKQSSSQITEAGTTETLGTAWLETTTKSDVPRALVCADCEEARLLPGPVVLYRSQGALWATTVAKFDRAMLDRAREAARRAVLLNNGKQIAVALVMAAAQDHLDLPDAGDPKGSKQAYEMLAARFPGADTLKGFVYTFKGGALETVQSPSETEFGFIPGKGGRAVIYADGHVAWMKE
ncbi:MAG TPA: hypothetical protein VGN26_05005 [Armatimonadota bacterium]|jgi:hypothetical protein